MSYSLHIVGIDKLQSLLGQDFGPAVSNATFAIGKEIEGEMATAPGPVKLPIQWASDKQRRGYFASRRKPFRRYVREADSMSQRLLAGWNTIRRGISAIVGNRADYAWFVQGEGQQPMHRNTGWVTDKEAVEQVVRSGAAKKLLFQAIMARLRG